MKAVVGHGALLVIALIAAWSTWSREESVTNEAFEATVWTADSEAVDSIIYASDDRLLVVSRRNEDGEDYLWGWEARTVLDSTGVPIPEQRDTSFFPVSDEGEDLFRLVAPLEALRDLGTMESLGPERRAEYGLEAPEDTLVVALRNGGEERILLGGAVFGGSGRYAVVPGTGRTYALSGILSQILESGRARLNDRDLHAFRLEDVTRVILTTPTSERVRVRTGGLGAASTWAAPDTPERVDATFGNFMSRIVGLRPTGYVNAEPADSLELLARMEYQDDDGDPMGVFEFFRGGDDGGGDEAVSYYIRTELTRILAQTTFPQVERIAEDLEELFGGQPGPQSSGNSGAGETLPP